MVIIPHGQRCSQFPRVLYITIYPITVLEVDNEKVTQSQLTWLLPENVQSTPKWHLGAFDLTLLSSSHFLKTTDYLQITVQLPLQLGVVIWLVFRSEWEQWSFLHQHRSFKKKWEIVWNGRDNFQVVPSVTRKGVTHLLMCEGIQAISEYYKYFFDCKNLHCTNCYCITINY